MSEIQYIDQQGSPIKIGVAYQFICGMPGPDVTCLIVESMNEDGTVNTWDLDYCMKVNNVKPDRLWRPLKHTWAAWGSWAKAAVDYAGPASLDLT